MTKKVWTASAMGRKGIRKMLEKFDSDPTKARKKIAQKKKRDGLNLGGRPEVYERGCTHYKPQKIKKKDGTVVVLARHRFLNGSNKCACGATRKAKTTKS